MKTTIILPVSRPFFLNKVFAALEFMNCDAENTNLIVYVDGDHMLYEKALHKTMNSKFKIKKCLFRAKGPANVSSIRRRRKRISDIHNEIKEQIPECDFVLSVEDDTVIPASGLEKLLKDHIKFPHAGIISAVELGRWGFLHVGAFNVDDVYVPTVVKSVPLLHGVQEVDATGLYCCLVRFVIYRNHNFEPFEDVLGPDFNFGLQLRKEGYKNYIDYDIHCHHLTQKGAIIPSQSQIVQVKIEKENGEWGASTTDIFLKL